MQYIAKLVNFVDCISDKIGYLVGWITTIMVIYSSKGFLLNSWAVREVSPDPGGLPARYLLKAMIPFWFSFLIVQGFSEACKNFMIIIGEFFS